MSKHIVYKRCKSQRSQIVNMGVCSQYVHLMGLSSPLWNVFVWVFFFFEGNRQLNTDGWLREMKMILPSYFHTYNSGGKRRKKKNERAGNMPHDVLVC